VLTRRVIAAVVVTAVFARTFLECRNGVQDGGGTSRRDELFSAFPGARAGGVGGGR
jgi:hypothetical protein